MLFVPVISPNKDLFNPGNRAAKKISYALRIRGMAAIILSFAHGEV
jgi:hypothetical protein